MSFANKTGGEVIAVHNKDAYDAWDDATWILTASFIIFTMQSGKFCMIVVV